MVSKLQLSALLVATIGVYVLASVSAINHIVGGDLGWDYPPNPTYFDKWAAKPRVFKVGDKLVFPFTGEAHNLIQVVGSDYNKCTMNQVINMFSHGPVTVSLDKVGDYYFFDGVGLHCEKYWVKLKITVVGAEAKAPPGPPPRVSRKEGMRKVEKGLLLD